MTAARDPGLEGETLRALVGAHGGEPGSVHAFDEDGVDLLPYATLLYQRQAQPEILAPVVGIYEWQDAPLLLIVDGDRLTDGRHLARIRRVAALRGDIPYLGVAAGGRLDVHVIGFDRGIGDKVDFAEFEIAAASAIPYIASARPALKPNATTISKVVLKLLNEALTKLKRCGLCETDAISLAGRALFARFLADRDLPLGDHMIGRRSDEAFADAASAVLTCSWLDTTFNGNLLPLDNTELEKLPAEGFGVLVDIMRRAPGGQLALGWEQKWDSLHFAHIPVGILSQVYERYLKAHEPKRQQREGSYYTPVSIADLMVRATLQGLAPERRHKARFLDPAAGAGVFLITAFRHLVAERWRHDGTRPSTAVLREILYGQIAGFDVNASALLFAALGLYLVSIELDPHPEPVSKLGFKDLRDVVLFEPMTNEAQRGGEVSLDSLGSLGPGVSDFHNGRYDVVIGNPPWKTGAAPKGWRWIQDLVLSLSKDRIGSAAREEIEAFFGHGLTDGASTTGSVTRKDASRRRRELLPNEALDIAFVWRASEWARSDGQIAFALHGRLLFQQSEGMPVARATLFSAFDVTSVINGALLRETKVWPHIRAPFCILFSRNRPAQPGTAFRLVTPREEPKLNQAGAFRLDAAHAPLVRTRDFIDDPLKLKTLLRGSELDLEIRRRIQGAGHPTLRKFLGGEASGVGIQSLRTSSRTRAERFLPGADAAYLKGLPYLRSGAPQPFIRAGKLPVFQDDRIHDPRNPRIFQGPLLIVDKVARATVRGFSAGVSPTGLAYSENYYGYRLPERWPAVGASLVAYLGSPFVRWWLLMTSGGYGFERDVVEKAAFDRLPVPSAWCDGDPLIDDDTVTRPDFDWASLARYDQTGIAKAFGLDRRDLQIIEDTLYFAFPNSTTVRTTGLDVSPFVQGLRNELAPWERELECSFESRRLEAGISPTWRFVEIGRAGGGAAEPLRVLEGLAHAADESGSTELYHRGEGGRLYIGLLAQPRYWTFSQGIRAARHIAWKHLDLLAGVDAGEEIFDGAGRH